SFGRNQEAARQAEESEDGCCQDCGRAKAKGLSQLPWSGQKDRDHKEAYPQSSLFAANTRKIARTEHAPLAIAAESRRSGWGWSTMSWLSLTQATTILDHDVQRGRASLERAISKAWIVGVGGSPAGHLSHRLPLNREQRSRSGGKILGAYGLAKKVRSEKFRPLAQRLISPCKRWTRQLATRTLTSSPPH